MANVRAGNRRNFRRRLNGGQKAFPQRLAKALGQFQDARVLQTHLVTTAKGGWKIEAVIAPGTPLPIAELEALGGSVPVQYEVPAARVMRARPAFPALGE